MRIALFGYGIMGRMIAELAAERNHQIVAKIDIDETEIDFSTFDVAIDFSTPDAAFNNITACFKNNVPVASGTTGWLHDFEKAVEICNQYGTAFVYASNFSLGVNIFFELNAYLAKMMSQLEQYKISMEEIHHTQKLDAPSGTAITLAEGILQHSGLTQWKLEEFGKDILPITSKREGKVPGTHSVDYKSEVDTIQIKHTAHNRKGFALGALMAAEWVQNKKGIFTMKDVLSLN